jgi:spermidine/putrescine-binding protein
MKKNFLKTFLITGIVIATLSSCTTFNHSMREPNTRVNLNKSDFTLSDQVTASATSTKIFSIDFERLFTKKTGVIEHDAPGINNNLNITIANIPVVGNLISDKTANYSLYELMTSNPGYDVVFYPRYETKIVRPVGIGFIVKVTTVKTTARLGKLNK